MPLFDFDILPSFNRSALSLFLLWDSLYLCISVEDRDYPRNGPVLEYHGYWRQGCNTRMATWGGNGVSRLQTRLGQLQKFYFNAKIASVAPAAAIMQPRDKKFGKSGAERLFAQSALLLMAKTFSQVEFLYLCSANDANGKNVYKWFGFPLKKRKKWKSPTYVRHTH